MKKRNKVIAVAMALLLAGGATAGAMGFGGMMNGMGFMNRNRTQTETETVDMTAKRKEMLDVMLESGKITEEQYNEYIADLENGTGFGGMHGKGMHMGGNKGMHGMPFMGFDRENMKMPEGFELPEDFKLPESFEKPEMPEMTEEKKAEMLEKAKEQLASMLEKGKITQEQYDEQLAQLESGEMARPFFGNRGNGFGFGFGNFGKDFENKEFKAPETPEMTEEKKAEMLEKAKEQLASMLEKGKITQEQYDEYLAKLEAGEMAFPFFGGMNGKNMQGAKNRPEKAEKPAKLEKPEKAEADTEATEEATEEANETVKTEKGKKMPAGGRGASKGNGFGAMGMGAKRR